MKFWLKKIVRSFRFAAILFDILLFPLTLVGIAWFRVARFWGVKRLPLMRWSFLKFGLYPLVDHYYDPQFDYQKVRRRDFPSTIEFNEDKQLSLLSKLNYQQELDGLPMQMQAANRFFYDNGSFGIGDAELCYSLIRHLKPARIVEVGSGYSTLLALEAASVNRQEGKPVAITCIEPYEMPYLEALEVTLIRKKVEEVEPVWVESLDANDILFIDSSHVLRPGGDVLHLVLGVLPKLRPGVWIHFHDIFFPEEYPEAWLRDEFRLWNEQYLLEAFLFRNPEFEVRAALNYLRLHHFPEVAARFPKLAAHSNAKPGSFWIQKK